jgi:nucleoside-diphosphate-sugar epimerase
MKKLLVTGASGFIGSHVMAALAGLGYEIHAFSSVPRISTSQVAWHKVDLHASAMQAELISFLKPEFLLHMAWYADHGKYWTSVRNLEWVETSLALVRNFAAAGGKRAVALGTCAEYDWHAGLCVEETTPRTPESLYGVCKNSLYEILSAYCRQEGISFTWGRVFFPYGLGEPEKKIVSSIITALLKGSEARCTDGEQVRDFIYVKDLANAIVVLLNSDLTGAVNLGSGQPRKLKDIAIEVGNIMHRPDLIKLGAIPRNENEAPMVVANITKLVSHTDWKPAYDLTSAIAETVDYWRNLRA